MSGVECFSLVKQCLFAGTNAWAEPSSVVKEQGQQDDYRDRYADEPKKCCASHHNLHVFKHLPFNDHQERMFRRTRGLLPGMEVSVQINFGEGRFGYGAVQARQ